VDSRRQERPSACAAVRRPQIDSRDATPARSAGLFFGAELAFIGDINGDGKDEFASARHSSILRRPRAPRQLFHDVGSVIDMTSKRRSPLLRLVGENELQGSQFGAQR
jgi:hypothetical protein